MTKRALIYALVGAVALIGWMGSRAPEPAATGANNRGIPTVVSSAASSQTRALPAQLERPLLVPADRNPFAATVVPLPAVAAPKKIPAATPPAPSAPALNLKFTGKMTAPDGTQLVFVAFGETPMSLSPGQVLPNGYKVLAINDRSIELNYLPLNFSTRFDLPEPPRHEIR